MSDKMPWKSYMKSCGFIRHQSKILDIQPNKKEKKI